MSMFRSFECLPVCLVLHWWRTLFCTVTADLFLGLDSDKGYACQSELWLLLFRGFPELRTEKVNYRAELGLWTLNRAAGMRIAGDPPPVSRELFQVRPPRKFPTTLS